MITCYKCGSEVESNELIADCSNCGQKDQVNCQACIYWEDENILKCVGCVAGSNIKTERA